VLEPIENVILIVVVGLSFCLFGEYHKRNGRDILNKYDHRISALAPFHQYQLLSKIVEFGQLAGPIVKELQAKGDQRLPIMPSIRTMKEIESGFPDCSRKIMELAVIVHSLESPSRTLREIGRNAVDTGSKFTYFGFFLTMAPVLIVFLLPGYAIPAMFIGTLLSVWVMSSLFSAYYANNRREKKLIQELETAEEEMRRELGSASRVS